MKKEVLKVLSRALRAMTNKKLVKENASLTRKEAYEIINKILLYRILEDKGFIEIGTKTLLRSNYLFEPLQGVLYRIQQEYKDSGEPCWTPEGKTAVKALYLELRQKGISFKEGEPQILGDIYEEFLEPKQRKSLGQFYTPPEIVEYIVQKALRDVDPVKNPFVKVGDIACGSGNFLVQVYDVLHAKFLKALSDLQRMYGSDYWQEKHLHNHLLEHCIFGMDTDGFAIDLTIINLLLKDLNHLPKRLNILKGDSLRRWEKEREINQRNNLFFTEKFDIIVGNPPYVGHKGLGRDYKKWLLKQYPEVFHDKSDLSYCFFQRILENLKEEGKGMIITSRYFMENPTGRTLRKYLQQRADIVEIVDFYGGEIFKGLGVATAIYLFTGKSADKEEEPILVRKLTKLQGKIDIQTPLNKLLEQRIFTAFSVPQTSLTDQRWTLISSREKARFQKIESLSSVTLGEVAKSFQGIITGCDKAFVMKNHEAAGRGIESDLLKNWIKSRHVEKYRILQNDQRLIYADLIKDSTSPSKAMEHISSYRERLSKRRECLRGIRPWHHLQWGRTPSQFEQKKILFPYKSDSNRFALDPGTVFCSADVYALVVKDKHKDLISLEFLLGLLNSAVYEEYFQSFGKNLGKGIYDYYPNSVMDLRIPLDAALQLKIEALVGKILKGKERTPIRAEIDQVLGDFFQISLN